MMIVNDGVSLTIVIDGTRLIYFYNTGIAHVDSHMMIMLCLWNRPQVSSSSCRNFGVT
jgi:hypothetical protein